MSTARKEYEVRRLLAKCELMIKQQKYNNDSRLDQFIETADELIDDLKTCSDPPSGEALNNYSRRIKFLKGLAEVNSLDNPLDKSVALTLAPKAPNTDLKKIQQTAEAQIEKQIRDELFGDSELRRRQVQEENIEERLVSEHKRQEKIAENMLSLAKNMKEQSLLANNLIKKDTSILDKASNLADSNFDQLKTESEKLQEQSSRAWQCWIWILLALVIVIFINMVLFMKISKKS